MTKQSVILVHLFPLTLSGVKLHLSKAKHYNDNLQQWFRESDWTTVMLTVGNIIIYGMFSAGYKLGSSRLLLGACCAHGLQVKRANINNKVNNL